MTYRFQQLEPQCARGAFLSSMMTDETYAAEVKYDGFRELAQFCGDTIRFTSRHKSVNGGLYVEKTDRVPHLSLAGFESVRRLAALDSKSLGARVKRMEGTVLDGEMVVALDACPAALRAEILADAGGKSKYVGRILGSDPAVAIAKQKVNGLLRFIAFDCLFYKGRDARGLGRDDRRELLYDAMHEWANPYSVCAIECQDPRRKEEWLAALWEAGEEGIILKKRDAPYGKKFQRCWVKRKQVINAEAFIIGYKAPKETSKKVNGEVSATKYVERGLIGSVVVAQLRDGKVWECASVDGMDEPTRELISRNQTKFLHRVIELKANGREPSGRFRHPKWKCWRPDKRAENCVYDPEET